MPVLSTAKLIIAGVIALAFAGLIAAVAIYRGNAISAEASLEAKKVELSRAVEVNETNVATIAQMREQKARDDDAVASLNETIASVSAQSDQLRTDIETLQRQSNEVNSYLGVAIPSDLARLLNRSAPSSNPNPVYRQPAAQGASRAVPKGK